MEKKYTLQDLSALLAERESLSPEQAEDFVRTFFELTEEGLLKDSFVKVTGFGTFKLVEVSERESVNINTGERFQISGHNKISFTPDGTLRELVNRPFAHFTTVTLNDNTPETALEAAEQTADEAPATPAKTETQVAETPSNEVDFDPIVEEKKAEKDDSTEETAVECTVPVGEATQTTPVTVESSTVLEPSNPIREQSSEVVENLHANCGSNNTVSEETSNTCKESKTIADSAPAIHTEQAEKEAAQPGHIKATTDVPSTKTARVSPATSPLLQRRTPVPIIADALLVSQTPSPVLNNELLSELLTETPDTEAAIAEDSIEEEEAITPLAVESADATTAYTAVAEVDIAELVEETNDTAEEVDEVEADVEDFEEETDDDAEEVEEVEVDEEDFKEEDAENSENIAELLEQTAAEAPLTEETAEETDTIAAQDDTNAQPAHTESESAPVVLSTVAAPIIDLALSEEPSAEIAEESAPVAAETSEEAPATPVEPEPSHGPALQFVPTREALRELSEEKPATQAPTTTATALPLRDQYRYPVDFEIKHSDPTPVLPEVPVEQAECKEEIPTATCETADAAEVQPAETPEVVSEMTEALPETEETAKTAHAEQVEIEQNSPALPSTIAAPQIDLEALETKMPSAEENLPLQTIETAIEGETPAESSTAAEVTETETAVVEAETVVDAAETAVSETETAVAEIATTAVETETAVDAAETEVSEAETTEEQTADTTATPTKSADETAIVAPPILSVPLSIATAVENKEPTETKEEALLVPTPEVPDTVEKVDSPAEEAEAPPTEQPLSEEAATQTATEQDEKSDDATTAAAATDTTGKENHERRKRRSRRRHRKRKSGEKMLGLILLLIVLFCCAFGYLCYSRVITPKDIPSWLHPVYEFFSPEDENGLHATSGVIGSANAQSVQPVLPTPAQRAAIAKAKEDSAKAEAIAEAERAAAESKAEAERQARVRDLYTRASRYPQVKDGSMLITGTHAVHKMKAGDNIYLIAERMYGSRGYAKYIIEYNNIQNPDFIKVNKVLKLPKLVNPKSIK
jgi:putative integration host factor IHF alpha subunit